MECGAGTAIRNLEGTSRMGKETLKRHRVSSWIQLLAKNAPALDKHDITHCAAYDRGVCKMTKAQTLFGCHCKLDRAPGTYIIPMCAAHNGKRAAGQRLLATRAFPALQLSLDDGDREAVVQRGKRLRRVDARHHC